VSKAEPTPPPGITVTPESDLGTPVRISGVTGVWSKDDGGSHVEYGNGQILAVIEPPIQIEHRLQVAGMAGLEHNDEKAVRVIRHANVSSRVRAAYDWFRHPVTSYEKAIASIDRAIEDTDAGKIHWENMNGVLYGSQSTNGVIRRQRTYRLEIAADGHFIYQYSNFVYTRVAAGTVKVINAGNIKVRDVMKDCAVQQKLSALLFAAQRAVTSRSNQIT
jgi:hypothetical protein